MFEMDDIMKKPFTTAARCSKNDSCEESTSGFFKDGKLNKFKLRNFVRKKHQPQYKLDRDLNIFLRKFPEGQSCQQFRFDSDKFDIMVLDCGERRNFKRCKLPRKVRQDDFWSQRDFSQNSFFNESRQVFDDDLFYLRKSEWPCCSNKYAFANHGLRNFYLTRIDELERKLAVQRLQHLRELAFQPAISTRGYLGRNRSLYGRAMMGRRFFSSPRLFHTQALTKKWL